MRLCLEEEMGERSAGTIKAIGQGIRGTQRIDRSEGVKNQRGQKLLFGIKKSLAEAKKG